MKWINIEDEQVLNELVKKSEISPQIIFKHSTRCSISNVAFSRLQSGKQDLDYYIVNVIANRNISNMIEETFMVMHQSPQLLIIYKGKSAFDTSHFGITSSIVESQLTSLQEI